MAKTQGQMDKGTALLHDAVRVNEESQLMGDARFCLASLTLLLTLFLRAVRNRTETGTSVTGIMARSAIPLLGPLLQRTTR